MSSRWQGTRHNNGEGNGWHSEWFASSSSNLLLHGVWWQACVCAPCSSLYGESMVREVVGGNEGN